MFDAAFTNALPPDTVLRSGEYTLQRVLGRGGFAMTYAARDNALNRVVALKEFFPPICKRDAGGVAVAVRGEDRPEFQIARDEFGREARALAKFAHPNIARVYATWDENETSYLALEYVHGETLAARLERVGALNEAFVLQIAQDLGAALIAVHDAGLLHRDVKPDNAMLEDGLGTLGLGLETQVLSSQNPSPKTQDQFRAVLLDFGLALEAPQGLSTRALNVSRALGTPAYAAPEQYGRRPKSPATDVYAFAATLYHALTGTAPPSASDRASGEELVSPREINTEISQTTSDAIVRGLELSVARRPPDARAFLELLIRTQSVSDGLIAPAQPVAVQSQPVAYALGSLRASNPRWGGALVGVPGRARGLAWAPDGARIAIAADSRLLWLWTPSTGREHRRRARTLVAGRDWLQSVAWSPDNRLLATGSADKTLRVWPTSFDFAAQTLDLGCEVSALSWTPDGQMLCVGGSDGRARIFARNGDVLNEEPQLLPGHAAWLRAVAATNDNVWATGDDGVLRCWKRENASHDDNWREAWRVPAHPHGARDLAINANATRIATVGGYDLLTKVWNAQSGELLSTHAGARGRLECVTWIGELVAAGGHDRAVRMWNPHTGAQVAVLPEHPADVTSLTASPDGATLCAGSDREVWLWRL